MEMIVILIALTKEETSASKIKLILMINTTVKQNQKVGLIVYVLRR